MLWSKGWLTNSVNRTTCKCCKTQIINRFTCQFGKDLLTNSIFEMREVLEVNLI